MKLNFSLVLLPKGRPLLLSLTGEFRIEKLQIRQYNMNL